MSNHPLPKQFREMHSNIALADRALVAIAAHVEVRSVLHGSRALSDRELKDVLVGSYARRVSIWPGKDVDVFGRLMGETVQSIAPDDAYGLFDSALKPFDEQGRLVRQPRSLKVSFGPDRVPSPDYIRLAAKEYNWKQSRVSRVIANLDKLGFDFSVDVVPAVRWNGHYGIPEVHRPQPWADRQRTGGWHCTDPVQLIDETRERNGDVIVGGAGGFVPTVKTLKQVKSSHLEDTKPSFLYYEFALHEGFAAGDIQGDSWADVTASALKFLAARLAEVDARPVCDPVLDQPYAPAPAPDDVAAARETLDALARRAQRAVTTQDACQAAIEWRHILGGNRKMDNVFPLPPGCRSTGVVMGGAGAANVATGGTAERSFGGR
ncbi:MAG: hypothetical protein KY462_00125 [Actinobacteria bacterium]|nr:hypothetical protein [Actinomycetota bacterium]